MIWNVCFHFLMQLLSSCIWLSWIINNILTHFNSQSWKWLQWQHERRQSIINNCFSVYLALHEGGGELFIRWTWYEMSSGLKGVTLLWLDFYVYVDTKNCYTDGNFRYESFIFHGDLYNNPLSNFNVKIY